MYIKKRLLLQTTSFLLIGLAAITCLLSTLGFVFKIQITAFHMPVSFALLCFAALIYWKTQKQTVLCAIFVSALIIISSVGISLINYDFSFDGSHYHLIAIINLINGWNPIYQPLLPKEDLTSTLVDCFAGKGSWYFAAALAKTAGKINASKAYHLITCAAALCLTILVLYNDKSKKQKIFSVIISVCIAANPVLLYQFTSNYIDAYMWNVALCLINALLLVDRNENNDFDLYTFVIIVFSISILMNIKFTGIFFAGGWYGLFYLRWLYKRKNLKALFKNAIPGVVGLLTGLFLGINPYITNLAKGENIFHPMLGNKKMDLLGANIPAQIRYKNNVFKLFYSMFCDAEGNLKLPLHIKASSFTNIGTDLRYEGFGVFFSLLFLFSIIGLIYIFLKRDIFLSTIQTKQIAFLCIAIWIMGLIFPESWWARYFAYWWMLPFLVLWILAYNNLRFNLLIAMLLTISVINNVVVFGLNFNHYYNMSKELRQALKKSENQDIILYIPDKYLFEQSTLYLLSEYNIQAKVSSEPFEKRDYNGMHFYFQISR